MRSSDPMKGVGCLRQQDGGHGSRNPLRSVQVAIRAHRLPRDRALWESRVGLNVVSRNAKLKGSGPPSPGRYGNVSALHLGGALQAACRPI